MAAGAVDKLCRRRWPLAAAKKALARVFICHGTHEHSGRYTELAAALNAGGMEAYALDYHGHGRREGAKGDFGDLDDAIDETVELIMSEARGPSVECLPVVIFGHSLGSMVAFLVAHKMAESPTLPTPHAVVLSGFAMDSVSPPFGVKALTPVLRALPSVIQQVTNVLASLAPQGPACPLPPASALMDDQERAAQSVADPLNYHGWIQNRTACALLEGRRRCQLHLHDFGRAFPFLMIHGEADDLCPRSACDALMAASPQSDKELKLYPSVHEVLNAKPATRSRALGDIVAWIETRAHKTAAPVALQSKL